MTVQPDITPDALNGLWGEVPDNTNWKDGKWLFDHIKDFAPSERPKVYKRIEELTGFTMPDTTIDSEVDDIFEIFMIEWGRWFEDPETAPTEAKEALTRAAHSITNLIAQEANKARETDEYGNPMVQLNMYEAEHVKALMDNLRQRDVQSYDTGDWWLDVPRKIAQRIAQLTAEKGSKE